MPFVTNSRLQGAFVYDCRTMTDAELVQKWVYRPVPYAFRSEVAAFETWRAELAGCLGVSADAIVMVGSTAAGLSLNPRKRLRLQRPDSDVDLAVISGEFFQVAWDWLVEQHVEKIDLRPQVKEWIDDHRRRLIFHRTIGCDQHLENLPFGRGWIKCLDAASSRPLAGGRVVKVRVYQNNQALMNYLVQGVADLRANLEI